MKCSIHHDCGELFYVQFHAPLFALFAASREPCLRSFVVIHSAPSQPGRAVRAKSTRSFPPFAPRPRRSHRLRLATDLRLPDGSNNENRIACEQASYKSSANRTKNRPTIHPTGGNQGFGAAETWFTCTTVAGGKPLK